MVWFPGVVLTQEVGTADPITLRSKTASRTDMASSPGFVALQAGRARLRGVSLVYECAGDACRLRFVGERGALASIRPEANLLLALGVEVLAIGHVPHVANDEQRHGTLFGTRDYGTADRMLHVSGAALLFGEKPRLPPLQPSPGSRTLVLAVLFGPYRTRAHGGVLRVGPECPAANKHRLLSIRNGGRVYLAQINGRSVRDRDRGRYQPVFYHQMPGVMSRRPVPHQPRLQECARLKREQVGWQGQAQRSQPACLSQQQGSTFAADGGAFPDRRAPPLLMVRVPGIQPGLFAGFGGLTGFLEALLGGVSAVREQNGGAIQGILQAFPTFGSRPHALLALALIVTREHIRVDTPALPVQRVCLVFGQGAGELYRAQHRVGLLLSIPRICFSFSDG
jgi:hypothetical protein